MSNGDEHPGTGRRGYVGGVVRDALGAIRQLVSGLRTAFLALLVLIVLVVCVLTVPLGVGLLAAPAALRALHRLAGAERARLARFGPEVVAPEPPTWSPTAPKSADSTARGRRA
ncbi:sensor domain-containing protein, partial [Streptomyces nigra]|uniref:sensor domain-containing protein n=1 Tax=Streptomyces nigra TaxID=1827580 RepID=UPI003426412E